MQASNARSGQRHGQREPGPGALARARDGVADSASKGRGHCRNSGENVHVRVTVIEALRLLKADGAAECKDEFEGGKLTDRSHALRLQVGVHLASSGLTQSVPARRGLKAVRRKCPQAIPAPRGPLRSFARSSSRSHG